MKVGLLRLPVSGDGNEGWTMDGRTESDLMGGSARRKLDG